MSDQKPRGGPAHTLWQPGQSGNPSGKPKGLLTKDKIAKIVSEISELSITEIKAIAESNDNFNRVAVAKIMLKTLATGDFANFNFLLDRAIGKVKDEVETRHGKIADDLKEVPAEVIAGMLKAVGDK